MKLDPTTGFYIDGAGKRYSLAGSGDGEVLIPLEIDPATLTKIAENNAKAAEARARLEPQLNHHLNCAEGIKQQMRDAGCFVPRSLKE